MGVVKKLLFGAVFAWGIASAQVTPLPQPVFPVAEPVTSTTILNAETQACNVGGGTVLFPPVTITAASGALTGPLPVCSTAAVFYSGTGFGYGGAGSSSYYTGTHFIGNGTFDFFDYNNLDCGGGTCVVPTNGSTFVGGMLGGGGVMNMTIDGFAYGVKVGALYNPGMLGGFFENLNIVNSTQWGFWDENFIGQTMFQNIRAVGNTAGGITLCSSAGTAVQNGNSFAYNLYSTSGSGITSRGIRICARGVSGALNQMIVDGLISIAENHTAATEAVTMMQTTAAGTITNGNPVISLASSPVVTNQPVIFNTSVGTGSSGVVAGTTYYAQSAFSSGFQVSTTVGGTPITFNASGSSTVSSPYIKVASGAAFIPGTPVVFTGTPTNTSFSLNTTYFVIYSADNWIGISPYVAGAVTASPTGAVSGLDIKTYGFSPLEVVGEMNAGGNATVLPASMQNIDLEVNGGTANSLLTIQQVRDTDFKFNYVSPGTTATVVYRSNNNVKIHPIADAAQTYDISADFAMPIIEGSRSQLTPRGGSITNLTGIGFSQLNPDFTDPAGRCASGSGLLYISGFANVDVCYNKNLPFLDFENFPLGAKTSQITTTETLAPGAATSNIAYTGPGGDTLTLPIVIANGDGEFHWVSNLSAGTFTLATQSSQLFNNAAGVTTYLMPANSSGLLWSTNDAGTLGWSFLVATVGVGSPGGTSGQVQYNNGGIFGALVDGSAGQVLTFTSPGSPPTYQTVTGTGTVSTTGSPASGNLAKFSGAAAITNGNLSGDCTTSGTLALTCLDTNGVAFGTAATANTGTSGATIPLLNVANTWSAAQTFNASAQITAPRVIVNAAISGTGGQIYGFSSTALGIASNGSSLATFASGGTAFLSSSIELTNIPASAATGYICYGTSNALSTSTSPCGTSKRDAKDDIEPLSTGLAEVLQLNPVSFYFKSQYGDPTVRQIGFIAEEMNQVEPRLVTHDQNGDIRGVAYQNVSALLAKAVQEQNAIVRRQQIEIYALAAWCLLLTGFAILRRRP